MCCTLLSLFLFSLILTFVKCIVHQDKRLTGYVFGQKYVIGPQMCIVECRKSNQCKSVNYDMETYTCELNNSSLTIIQGTLSTTSGYRYMESDTISQSEADICVTSNICQRGSTCVTLKNGGYACPITECVDDPPSVSNGVVVITGRYVGQILNYSCNNGYTVEGSTTITCKPNGQWSAVLFNCTVSISDCLTDTSCWVKYNFTYDNSWNSCNGERYITTYNTLYVGVILCSSQRYKLFLSNTLESGYKNIGDGSGYGHDHCEIVHGDETTAILAADYINAPTVTGYYRTRWGYSFSYGTIGYSSTAYYYCSWYECSVNIPGTGRVVVVA